MLVSIEDEGDIGDDTGHVEVTDHSFPMVGRWSRWKRWWRASEIIHLKRRRNGGTAEEEGVIQWSPWKTRLKKCTRFIDRISQKGFVCNGTYALKNEMTSCLVLSNSKNNISKNLIDLENNSGYDSKCKTLKAWSTNIQVKVKASWLFWHALPDWLQHGKCFLFPLSKLFPESLVVYLLPKFSFLEFLSRCWRWLFALCRFLAVGHFVIIETVLQSDC